MSSSSTILLLGVSPDCDHTSQPCPHRRHHIRPDGFRIFLERPTLVAVSMELQQLFDNDTRPASQASWLVSDGSHRQHRWSPPTTSARYTAPSSCSRDPSPPQVCAPLQRDHHTGRHHQSVPIRSLSATFRTRPARVAAHADNVAVDPPLSACTAGLVARPSFDAFGNPVGRLVYRLLLHDPPLCAAAAAATQPVFVSIAALPDVAQFDWTMCSVEQAALHTLASHLEHFKKLTVFQGCPTRCTSLPSFRRASHHWCSGHRLRCVNCQDSRLQVRDCRSLFLWLLGDTCSPSFNRRQFRNVRSLLVSIQCDLHETLPSLVLTDSRSPTVTPLTSMMLLANAPASSSGCPPDIWLVEALRPALAALQCASRKPPDTSLLCIFQLACSQAQASMTRGQLRAFRGQHGDESNIHGFQCLSKSCLKFTFDGSVQPLCATTSTLSQSSHGRSGCTPDGRRAIPRIVRKALAAWPWFFCNELPLGSRLNKCCKLLVRRRSQQLKPITLSLDLPTKLPEHVGSNGSSYCDKAWSPNCAIAAAQPVPQPASTVSSRFVQQWLSRTGGSDERRVVLQPRSA